MAAQLYSLLSISKGKPKTVTRFSGNSSTISNRTCFALFNNVCS